MNPKREENYPKKKKPAYERVVEWGASKSDRTMGRQVTTKRRRRKNNKVARRQRKVNAP